MTFKRHAPQLPPAVYEGDVAIEPDALTLINEWGINRHSVTSISSALKAQFGAGARVTVRRFADVEYPGDKQVVFSVLTNLDPIAADSLLDQFFHDHWQKLSKQLRMLIGVSLEFV